MFGRWTIRMTIVMMVFCLVLLSTNSCSDDSSKPLPPEKKWRTMTSGTTEHLRGVWGVSDSHVFAVGDDGAVIRYNGAVWTVMQFDANVELWALWGSAENDVYAGGIVDTIYHYNGSTWEGDGFDPSKYILGIWGAAEDDIFGVG